MRRVVDKDWECVREAEAVRHRVRGVRRAGENVYWEAVLLVDGVSKETGYNADQDAG